MKASGLPGFALAVIAALASTGAAAATVDFAGYRWLVRNGGGGPGPNRWNPNNVWVDAQGMHLKIAFIDGHWQCAEVTMTQALGFGSYQFEVTGRPDMFDRRVVLGLFNYTTPAIGPDGTNEIDIEFSQWDDASNRRRLSWTVYPPASGPPAVNRTVPIVLTGSASTHRFDWRATGIGFQSLHGYQDMGNANQFAAWTFAPANPQRHIPQQPLPIHMNLWLFGHPAPVNGQPVEVVIRAFSFTPH